jgi:hypothetical protein
MKKYFLIPAMIFLFLRMDAQNYSLTFNGSSQYVNIASQASLGLSANFTIEGWIDPTGTGSDATQGGIIINKENSYEIARFADGSLQYALSANGAGTDWNWTNTGFIAPLNTWTHFALVKSGTTVTFYFNASKNVVNGSNPATLTANTQALRIGDRSNTGQFFQGNIDEIRLWNIARSQVDIKANAFNKNLSNGASGLVGYYRMNENTGTTTANSSTNTTGIDGTLVNAPTWTASPVQFGASALSFDGTNDLVSIPEDATLDISSAITLEAWVFATKNTGGIQDVISKSNSTTNTGYIFPRTDDNWAHVDVYLNIGGWKTLTVAYAMLNAWHHLAFTYDGATMKIYIDGVLAGSQAQTGTIAINGNAVALGTQPGFPENFGGSADEIRIWNVARTQAQIQGAMNGEIDPTTQTGLVSYYTSDQGIPGGTNTGLTNLIDQKGNNNGTITNFSLTSSTSNFVTQNPGISVLPLSWLDFTVVQQESKVALRWETSEEENTNNFTIQHSTNGSSWNNIGTVPAAGNSTTERDYVSYDLDPDRGINFYRIEEMDIDGDLHYSKVASAIFNGAASQLVVFPNPLSTGNLNIKLPAASKVLLYNITGELLISKEFPAGTQQLNTSKLSKGVYFLKAGDAVARIVIL